MPGRIVHFSRSLDAGAGPAWPALLYPGAIALLFVLLYPRPRLFPAFVLHRRVLAWHVAAALLHDRPGLLNVPALAFDTGRIIAHPPAVMVIVITVPVAAVAEIITVIPIGIIWGIGVATVIAYTNSIARSAGRH